MTIQNKSLSASRISTLNACAQKHYYAYTLGLQKPGETGPQALGTAVHKAIETMYSGGRTPPLEQSQGFNAAEYNTLVDAFGTFALLRDGNLKTIAVEKQFELPLEDTDGWSIKGIIDHVAEIDGELWVGDHKTTRRKWPIEKTSLSLQHKIYELAIPDLYNGRIAAGSFYNFIQLGTSKGIPYANVERTFLPRNEIGLENAYNELLSAIDRIENGPVYRNTGDHCQWCEFFTLCQSDYFGGDTQSAIDMNYVKKTDRKVEDNEIG